MTTRPSTGYLADGFLNPRDPRHIHNQLIKKP
jgi:hypothetical protein